MMKSKHLFFDLIAALLLAGCHTPEYYQDRAVQKAREFLLERTPEFSPAEIAFVRYNRPALLTAPIFGAVSGGGKIVSGTGFGQICIAWILPTREPVYMVYGASQGNMRSWKPERVIRKVFHPVNRRKLTVLNTARVYIRENFYYDLSASDYNYIRFAMPELRETNYSPVPGSAGVSSAGVPPEGLRQISAVWKLPSDAKKILAVVGYGTIDLATWTINTAGIRSASELEGTILLEKAENGISDSDKQGEKK